MKIAHKSYAEIITLENLFCAWEQFKKGKRNKPDVAFFERHLENNLFHLHTQLRDKNYCHGVYSDFYITDPKLRHIHKATVKDRVIHHLLYTYLYEIFDKTFIYDSYSCRLEKGTHKAVSRLETFTRIVSKNYTRSCWGLKCDIKKFFASVDHQILVSLLEKRIADKDILWLLSHVIDSFTSNQGNEKGIPLGNLTSQVCANIYLNELDQFVKHTLKAKYYLRYADDFLFLSHDKKELECMIPPIAQFLEQRLSIEMHPQKISLRQLVWGIDFLGYIILPHYRLPRTKTKKRIFKKLKEKIHSASFDQSLQSYLGYLAHANSFKLTQELKNQMWVWR